MKDGHVAELDTPLNLMNDKQSELAQMVDSTGPENAHKLRQMALNTDRHPENDIPGVMLVTAL